MPRPSHLRLIAPALFAGLFALALIATGLYTPVAAAQNAASPTQHLRALAVYEYTGSYQHPTRSRLVPITIWDGTQFQPGSLYLADPVPLSVESGTLYELTQNGLGLGQFEVMQPEQIAHIWIGLGQYLPNPPASSLQLNLPASLMARAKFESDTPHFAYTPPASTGVAAGYQPNRSRPRLTLSHAATSPVTHLQQKALTGLPPQMQQIAAISDPASDSDTTSHSYAWDWPTPGDRIAAQHKLEALALQLLTPSKPQLASPSLTPENLTAEHFRAFQLSYGSGPVYVFSARTSAPAKTTTYITLIAKPDFTGGLIPLFQSTTRASQPRLRLIDAVDATGSGPADLLFDLLTRHTRHFELIRVEGRQAHEIFRTGQ